MDALDGIIDRLGDNYVNIEDGDFIKVITNATVTNDPERNLSHDGVIAVEISGDAAE